MVCLTPAQYEQAIKEICDRLGILKSRLRCKVQSDVMTSVEWAWWDADKKRFRHVYRSEMLVRMCSPDGFYRAEVDGKGKVVEVVISVKS